MNKKDIARRLVPQKANCVLFNCMDVQMAIDNLTKTLQSIPDEYKNSAKIIYGATLTVIYYRHETDIEWNIRLRELDAKELAERQLYEKLKVKYAPT